MTWSEPGEYVRGSGAGTLAVSLLLPVAAWLAGLTVFTVVSVESLFGEEHVILLFARLTAYVTSVMVAAVTLGLVALFGICCGAMLWWLDDPLAARRVAGAVGGSFWAVCAYTWVGVGLLLAEPPVAVTAAEMAEPEEVEAQLQAVPAYLWLTRLRYAVLGAFLALAVYSLARAAKPVNAVLAVAFGAAVVVAVVALLGALGGSEPE